MGGSLFVWPAQNDSNSREVRASFSLEAHREQLTTTTTTTAAALTASRDICLGGASLSGQLAQQQQRSTATQQREIAPPRFLSKHSEEDRVIAYSVLAAEVDIFRCRYPPGTPCRPLRAGNGGLLLLRRRRWPRTKTTHTGRRQPLGLRREKTTT